MRRYLTAIVLGLLVSVLLAAQIMPASAEGDGLLDGVDEVVAQTDDVVADVTETVDSAVGGTTGSAPSAPTNAAGPAADEAGGGGGDHASATVAELLVLGNETIEIGSAGSSINEDGSTNSDVTVLALGGQEIVGSHASSDGEEESSNDALAPVCDGSGGQLCLGLLYAHSAAHEDGNSSTGSADTALAYVCAGGSATDPKGQCDGPADAGVSESHASIERDKATGSTSADAESDLVDVCLGGRAADGTCSGIGANAVHSESHSDAPSHTQPGTSSRDSYLLGVDVAGQHQEILGDPETLSIPPDCPDSGAACVFLNEGSTHIRIGGASADQDVLHLVVKLPNLGNLIELRLGHTETSVDNPGPDMSEIPPGDAVKGERQDKPKKANRPPTVAAGNLPFTGGDALSWIALAMLLVASGSFVWLRSRVAHKEN